MGHLFLSHEATEITQENHSGLIKADPLKIAIRAAPNSTFSNPSKTRACKTPDADLIYLGAPRQEHIHGLLILRSDRELQGGHMRRVARIDVRPVIHQELQHAQLPQLDRHVQGGRAGGVDGVDVGAGFDQRGRDALGPVADGDVEQRGGVVEGAVGGISILAINAWLVRVWSILFYSWICVLSYY